MNRSATVMLKRMGRSVLMALIFCLTLLSTRAAGVGAQSQPVDGPGYSDSIIHLDRTNLDTTKWFGYKGPDLYEELRRHASSGERSTYHGATASDALTHPDDIYWAEGFGGPGGLISGGDPVNVMTVYNNMLIIGGDLRAVGSLPVNNIAGWDSNKWVTLGNGVSSPIWGAMAVYNNQLVVTTESANPPRCKIMSWDGTRWSVLTDSMSGWVEAIIEYNGQLVVAGSMTKIDGTPVAGLAVWNGHAWSDLGGGTNGTVAALATYHNSLIVGGSFSTAGGMLAANIAAWNGSNWSPVGEGTDGWVMAFAVNNDQLFAAGSFSQAGGSEARNIASWNDTLWQSLGEGTHNTVWALTIFDGQLIAGGVIDSAGGAPADKVAAWDGRTWTAMDVGQYGWVRDMTVYGGRLYIGGHFNLVRNLVDGGWAVWDTSLRRWNWPTGNGTNGPVQTTFVFHDTLFAGGEFDAASTNATHKIAAWDGYQWSSLGTGVNHGIGVRALTAYGGELVAGGDFDSIGNIHASAIAAWSNGAWHSLGEGIVGSVGCLKNYGNRLIAGGNFHIGAGGDTIRSLAAWNGQNWAKLGAGLAARAPYEPRVYGMDTSNGVLLVAGQFDSAGGVAAKNIALWDGANWQAMGDGLEGSDYWDGVYRIAFYANQVIAGGRFTHSGDSTIGCVAAWNGTRWTDLGSGIPRTPNGIVVLAMTVYDDKLIVGGFLDSAGGQSVSSIASWDGATWSPLGSGITNPIENWVDWRKEGWVNSLCVYREKLHVGGLFSLTGDKVSSCFAVWTKQTPTDTPDDNLILLPTSIAVSQNYPNPFNPSTTIEYSLDHRDHVSIDIYNSLGEFIKQVIDETKAAGRYQVVWNGTDQRGRQVATGVYFYRVKIGDQEASKKMLLLK